MTDQPGPIDPADCGYVFATTGPVYTGLARRAARTLRQVLSGAQVDLFTDRPLDDPVFDQIHTLATSSPRPKMEALRRARFDRVIYLDADVIVLADISDIFRLLDRFDFVAAHARGSNMDMARRPLTRDIPAAFPPVNSGVIGLRQSPQTAALTHQWETARIAAGDDVDQPYLHHALYHSDLRLGILPPEYNLLLREQIRVWTSKTNAPRVLHCPQLYRAAQPGAPTTPFALSEVMQPGPIQHLRNLLAADFSLDGDPALEVLQMNAYLRPDAAGNGPADGAG